MKYLSILCAVLGMASCKAQQTQYITKIDVVKMQQEVIGKEVQLIDVRSAKEYVAGHIDDAINIDIANRTRFKIEVAKLDKTKPIYIYCYVGGRSNRASKVLEAEGFTQIYDFSGGWKAWSKR